MTRCDDCGAVLLADGTCSVCREGRGHSRDRPSGGETGGSHGEVHQSISVDSSEVDGGVTNRASGRGSGKAAGNQSITVENSRVDGEVANYHIPERTGKAAELVETALNELHKRREELESSAVGSEADTTTQVLALVNDASTIERIRELDSTETPDSIDSAREASDPVPVAHTLDVLAEVDRLAAEGSDLEALYVAIEKAIRLLSELDTSVEEELQAFVDRQRALTEGSLFDEEFGQAARFSLEELCDRARDEVARQAGENR